MAVSSPLWVLLVASALGGAAVTGLVTVGVKFIDLRHRHDEVRRDYYVSTLRAIDESHEAVIAAVRKHNEAADDSSKAASAEELLKDADRKVDAVRQAFTVVSLFAPSRVVIPLSRLVAAVNEPYYKVYQARKSSWSKVPATPFPIEEFRAFRDATRRDLGVERLEVPTSALQTGHPAWLAANTTGPASNAAASPQPHLGDAR